MLSYERIFAILGCDECHLAVRNGIKTGDGWDGDRLDLAFACAIEAELRVEVLSKLKRHVCDLRESHGMCYDNQGAWVRFAEVESLLVGASVQHDSDCSLHNMPAYPAGPCDCSVSRFNDAPVAEPGWPEERG